MALNWLKSSLACLLATASLSCVGAQELAASGKATVAPPRVVSLAPSNTELLFSINAGDSVVGVSTHCDYPPEATKRAKVGSFTSVSMERLSALKPDAVLLVNGQEPLAATIRRHNFKVVLLNNDSLSQLPINLRALGTLTGQSSAAESTARALSGSLHELTVLTGTCPQKPTVFYCVWPQPLMTVGGKSFLNEVIEASGGTNIARGLQSAYPQLSVEKLILANPDVIVLPHQALGQKFLKRPPWTYLSAVVKGRVFFLPEPDKDNLSRPTLRIVDGLYWLTTRIHPELNTKLESWYAESRKRLAAR